MEDRHRGPAALAWVLLVALMFSALLLPTWRHRHLRVALGLTTTAAVLCITPLINRRTLPALEPVGASIHFVLSILYFTFLAQAHTPPTALQLCVSMLTLPFQSVINAHQRWLAQQHKQPGATTAATAAAVSRRALCVMLWEAAIALLASHMVFDIGMYVLCSNGMCSNTQAAPGEGALAPWHLLLPTKNATSSPLAVDDAALSVTQPSYLVRCLFAFPAGLLLTQHLEVAWGTVRVLLLLGGFVWPALGAVAAKMPLRACKAPVLSASVREFWGVRWQQGLRVYFVGLGGAAADGLLALLWRGSNSGGNSGNSSVPRSLRMGVRCMATFLLSGAIHEYIMWALLGGIVGPGWQMSFFLLHGLAVLLEQAALALWGQQHPTGLAMQRLQRVWTLAFFFLTGPLFVEPFRLSGIFEQHPGLHHTGARRTPQVLRWLQDLLLAASAGV